MFRSFPTALLLFASVLAGCHTPRKLELTSSGAPAFERFSAEYEIPSAADLLSRRFAGSAVSIDKPPDDLRQVQQVTATTSSTPAENSTALLRVECPHPSGEIDAARLTLEVRSHDQTTGREASVEVRRLMIPRQQIDLLIVDLARAGFFDEPEPPGARSSLSVTIDESRVARRWILDDRLLDFAHRTLKHGSPASD